MTSGLKITDLIMGFLTCKKQTLWNIEQDVQRVGWVICTVLRTTARCGECQVLDVCCRCYSYYYFYYHHHLCGCCLFCLNELQNNLGKQVPPACTVLSIRNLQWLIQYEYRISDIYFSKTVLFLPRSIHFLFSGFPTWSIRNTLQNSHPAYGSGLGPCNTGNCFKQKL